ncbi:MAG TPA: type II toxin-antitoxin system RelE family toxin [Candidatus Avalokitesvara rifleensis]|uniref:type II toxin-antitoxin system RelE family toxin n=1 Tax=Candidatus Avalokitesvara rifleensis TaxID=3367620 RepID=UPI00271381DB|nr:type II toxin-antitoxin system RelE/ParE family toxin [Candidatus Brocadiales bacterium]
MTYRIEFTAKARRQLKDLSKADRHAMGRIKTRIDALANNPRPPDVKKLSGTESLYRIRVGDYRIIYEIQDRVLVVLVVKIGRRGDVYRPS